METVESVIEYWFGTQTDLQTIVDSKVGLWWGKSEDVDRDIYERFHGLLMDLDSNNFETWKSSPQGMLAMVLCADQFTRNMFRGSPTSFSFDARARALATRTIDQGWHLQLRLIERVFLYLPFEHSESIEDQNRSVQLYESLQNAGTSDRENEILAGYLEFAVKHQVIIERFGRFPHRNAILARESTQEEIEFLEQPGSSF